MKKALIGWLVLNLGMAGALAQTVSSWKRIGPDADNNADVYSIGVHPKTNSILLIGCRPHLVSAAGSRMSTVITSLKISDEMDAANQRQDNANVIDLSIDGGVHWDHVGAASHVPCTPSSGPNWNGVRFNAYFPNEAWVGLEDNYTYHSSDGGRTWQQVKSGLGVRGGESSKCVPFGFDPRSPKIVYLGTNNGLFKMTDGKNWVQLTQGLVDGSYGTIAVDSTHPDTIYVGTDDAIPKDGLMAGVYKSTDAGAHWTFAGKGLPSVPVSPSMVYCCQDMKMDPSDPKTLYFLDDTGELFKTSDGAQTWAKLINPAGKSWEERRRETTDSELATCVAINPANSQDIFLGTFGSIVYESKDGGKTWKSCSDGLTGFPSYARIEGLEFGTQPPYPLYAGTSEGLYVLTSSSAAPK